MKTLYTFFVIISSWSWATAQQTWALKPYSLVLPRVTTTQQTSQSLVVQQSGSMVYNTEQQAVAIHNGSGWNLLETAAGQFKNAQAFYASSTTTWTIPAGVTQFLIEAWGGGAGGGLYYYNGSSMFCWNGGGKGGGSAGGYIRRLMKVVSGSPSVSIQVGNGGNGASRTPSTTATAGQNTIVSYNGGSMTAFGGSPYESVGYATDNFSPSSNPGSSVIFFGQTASGLTFTHNRIDASNFILTIKGSDGGLAYGALPGQAGGGATFALQNGTTLLFESSLAYYNSSPGVGGGCGYTYGSFGGAGLVIIRW